jgi:hypothetical protein
VHPTVVHVVWDLVHIALGAEDVNYFKRYALRSLCDSGASNWRLPKRRVVESDFIGLSGLITPSLQEISYVARGSG